MDQFFLIAGKVTSDLNILTQIVIYLLFVMAVINEIDKLRTAKEGGKTLIRSFIDWLRQTLGNP